MVASKRMTLTPVASLPSGRAAKAGTIRGAGLDVCLNEPTPDPELVALPNLAVYPHHSRGTFETRAAMSQLVLDNLAAHFAGRPLLTPV